MDLVVDELPELGVTRLLRWIFNCYAIIHTENRGAVVGAGLQQTTASTVSGVGRSVSLGAVETSDCLGRQEDSRLIPSGQLDRLVLGHTVQRHRCQQRHALSAVEDYVVIRCPGAFDAAHWYAVG